MSIQSMPIWFTIQPTSSGWQSDFRPQEVARLATLLSDNIHVLLPCAALIWELLRSYCCSPTCACCGDHPAHPSPWTSPGCLLLHRDVLPGGHKGNGHNNRYTWMSQGFPPLQVFAIRRVQHKYGTGMVCLFFQTISFKCWLITILIYLSNQDKAALTTLLSQVTCFFKFIVKDPFYNWIFSVCDTIVKCFPLFFVFPGVPEIMINHEPTDLHPQASLIRSTKLEAMTTLLSSLGDPK